eukprot:m.351728 g.351728  ORF g.351728 m.351728 type:complete len:437 (+) comp16331_c0_seq1:342-1652(+)
MSSLTSFDSLRKATCTVRFWLETGILSTSQDKHAQALILTPEGQRVHNKLSAANCKKWFPGEASLLIALRIDMDSVRSGSLRSHRREGVFTDAFVRLYTLLPQTATEWLTSEGVLLADKEVKRCSARCRKHSPNSSLLDRVNTGAKCECRPDCPVITGTPCPHQASNHEVQILAVNLPQPASSSSLLPHKPPVFVVSMNDNATSCTNLPTVRSPQVYYPVAQHATSNNSVYGTTFSAQLSACSPSPASLPAFSSAGSQTFHPNPYSCPPVMPHFSSLPHSPMYTMTVPQRDSGSIKPFQLTQPSPSPRLYSTMAITTQAKPKTPNNRTKRAFPAITPKQPTFISQALSMHQNSNTKTKTNTANPSADEMVAAEILCTLSKEQEVPDSSADPSLDPEDTMHSYSPSPKRAHTLLRTITSVTPPPVAAPPSSALVTAI